MATSWCWLSDAVLIFLLHLLCLLLSSLLSSLSLSFHAVPAQLCLSARPRLRHAPPTTTAPRRAQNRRHRPRTTRPLSTTSPSTTSSTKRATLSAYPRARQNQTTRHRPHPKRHPWMRILHGKSHHRQTYSRHLLVEFHCLVQKARFPFFLALEQVRHQQSQMTSLQGRFKGSRLGLSCRLHRIWRQQHPPFRNPELWYVERRLKMPVKGSIQWAL